MEAPTKTVGRTKHSLRQQIRLETLVATEESLGRIGNKIIVESTVWKILTSRVLLLTSNDPQV